MTHPGRPLWTEREELAVENAEILLNNPKCPQKLRAALVQLIMKHEIRLRDLAEKEAHRADISRRKGQDELIVQLRNENTQLKRDLADAQEHIKRLEPKPEEVQAAQTRAVLDKALSAILNPERLKGTENESQGI